MPLASFPLMGWPGGHVPSALGSTKPLRDAAAAVAGSGGFGTRGTGGYGNGDPAHSTFGWSAWPRAFHARHVAYATPPRRPTPSIRLTVLRNVPHLPVAPGESS